jgi:uncharacterized protein (TIGR02466 family)
MKSEIHPLFATPIYRSRLERQFTNNEIKFVKDQINFCYKNTGNMSSNNTYILKVKELESIKIFIEECIKDYFEKVLKVNENVKPYITQSWLNYTKKDEYHHRHEHANSYVSGVFYFNANKENDNIEFFKKKNETIRPNFKEYNIYNSSSWTFPIQTGDIIMFPSSLTHDVKIKKGNNIRISLAFNIFVNGILGLEKQLTELKL